MVMGMMAMAHRREGVVEDIVLLAIGLQADDLTMVMRGPLVMFGGQAMMFEDGFCRHFGRVSSLGLGRGDLQP
jgi:hypothetical protein